MVFVSSLYGCGFQIGRDAPNCEVKFIGQKGPFSCVSGYVYGEGVFYVI